MSNKTTSVSVVIPTLGRPSLVQAVKSCFEQTLLPAEVIVVDASPDGLNELALALDSRVIIVRVGNISDSRGRWTAAQNRNFGIREATSEWVAFLDDDDEWLPTKLEEQLPLLVKNPLTVASCAAYYTRKSGRKSIRPRVVLRDDLLVLEQMYGSRKWRRLPSYIPTPSLVVSRDLALNVPFPEDLLGFEDTWWLFQLESRGASIVQLAEPLVIVNAEPWRSIERDSVLKNVAWARQLHEVAPKFSRNFLLGVATRNAVLQGRVADVIGLARGARSLGCWRFADNAIVSAAIGLASGARLLRCATSKRT